VSRRSAISGSEILRRRLWSDAMLQCLRPLALTFLLELALSECSASIDINARDDIITSPLRISELKNEVEKMVPLLRQTKTSIIRNDPQCYIGRLNLLCSHNL
jgi:hypothetical protein